MKIAAALTALDIKPEDFFSEKTPSEEILKKITATWKQKLLQHKVEYGDLDQKNRDKKQDINDAYTTLKGTLEFKGWQLKDRSKKDMAGEATFSNASVGAQLICQSLIELEPTYFLSFIRSRVPADQLIHFFNAFVYHNQDQRGKRNEYIELARKNNLIPEAKAQPEIRPLVNEESKTLMQKLAKVKWSELKSEQQQQEFITSIESLHPVLLTALVEAYRRDYTAQEIAQFKNYVASFRRGTGSTLLYCLEFLNRVSDVNRLLAEKQPMIDLQAFAEQYLWQTLNQTNSIHKKMLVMQWYQDKSKFASYEHQFNNYRDVFSTSIYYSNLMTTIAEVKNIQDIAKLSFISIKDKNQKTWSISYLLALPEKERLIYLDQQVASNVENIKLLEKELTSNLDYQCSPNYSVALKAIEQRIPADKKPEERSNISLSASNLKNKAEITAYLETKLNSASPIKELSAALSELQQQPNKDENHFAQGHCAVLLGFALLKNLTSEQFQQQLDHLYNPLKSKLSLLESLLSNKNYSAMRLLIQAIKTSLPPRIEKSSSPAFFKSAVDERLAQSFNNSITRLESVADLLAKLDSQGPSFSSMNFG